MCFPVNEILDGCVFQALADEELRSVECDLVLLALEHLAAGWCHLHAGRGMRCREVRLELLGTKDGKRLLAGCPSHPGTRVDSICRPMKNNYGRILRLKTKQININNNTSNNITTTCRIA